ncbi:hypothetical protein GCM10023201_53340 [Actinomycetospora corticicola]|uniref:DUF4190 domain-containing protein n=1 Tax=Actinomycetospora corticicola TaxID=663602 RepID=A0A7Y9DS43_9PSEU|nr:DUF4190 domain-containing protein [Actinomycetospora corticicola]NYD34410.1 hypothetical protein [Actinomycetospora corticicola]
MSQPQYPSPAPEPGGFGPPVPPQGRVPAGHGAPLPPGPPPGPAPTPTAGTNVMAVLAIVFAFLFSPLGIVFGIVGRRQTARTGQPGRGLATTGLVLSVVFLLLGIAAAVSVTVLAGSLLRSLPTTGVPELPAVSTPAVTGPVGPGTVTVADGDYGPELPADALAAEVGSRAGAADVICPGYLPAQVEASSTCDGTLDGQAARFRATVTAVNGSEASIDIARER